MSWRDRARRIDQQEVENASAPGGWRSRAKPVESPKEESFWMKAGEWATKAPAAVATGGLSLLASKDTPLRAFEALGAPGEVIGEAIRMPIEGDSDFRAPTVLQNAGLAEKTSRPPGEPINIGNRLVKSGAAAASALPKGLPAAAEAGRNEYWREPDLVDSAQDIALGLLAGKVAPQAFTAPVEAVANIPIEAANAFKSVARGVKKGGEKVGIQAMRTILGPQEGALRERFRRPEAVKNALEPGQISHKLAKTATDLSKATGEADKEAWKTLSGSLDPKKGAIWKERVADLIKSLKRSTESSSGGTFGRSNNRGVELLDDYLADLKKVGGRKSRDISESDLKSLIHASDQDINYDDLGASVSNRLLSGFRDSADDVLKGQNKTYEAAMVPVARKTKAIKGLESHFGITRKKGDLEFLPGNVTPGKITQLGRRELPESERIVKLVKEETGMDLDDLALLALAKEEFRPGRKDANGFRRAGTGAATGAALGAGAAEMIGAPKWVGGTFGAAAGAGAGMVADFYGGQAAGEIIDGLSKLNKTELGALLRDLSNGKRVSGVRVPKAAAPFISALPGLNRDRKEKPER